MKKILITGGSGFIGRFLKKQLEKKYELLLPGSRELNVFNKADLKKYEQEHIDYVVHLAGKTFVPDSWDNPVSFLEVNTLGTANVLEFCRNKKIGMTYISAYIYGVPKNNPISENAEIHPNNPYAQSKRMAEELCEFYSQYYGMDISVMRLFNVYGPEQPNHFLIPHIVKEVLSEKETIEVLDLVPKRDFVYVTDVCAAIEASIEHSESFQLYNVGTGISYSVAEIIDICQKIAGTQKEIVSKNAIRKNELNDVRADIKHIGAMLHWKPTITIEEGLESIIRGKR